MNTHPSSERSFWSPPTTRYSGDWLTPQQKREQELTAAQRERDDALKAFAAARKRVKAAQADFNRLSAKA